VSWLFEGQIEHRDSLGSHQLIRPGELNIMTAGQGIAHSERSIATGQDLHGVQLWIVLPDGHRDTSPMFHHHKSLPSSDVDGIGVKTILGNFQGIETGVEVFSPLIGLELRVPRGHTSRLPLEAAFEHGFHVVSGTVRVGGVPVNSGSMLYVPAGQSEIEIDSPEGALLMMIGGLPFNEPIIMWWNFIGRSQAEIVKMRSEWSSHSDRFPDFIDEIGVRIEAPPLPNVGLVPRTNKPKEG
jgi:redox-sensitive bicupin YhaK (pirin superfamily)